MSTLDLSKPLLINVKTPINFLVAFRRKLEDSVAYRNKCNIPTELGPIEEEETYRNYCSILLHEVISIIQEKKVDYDHIFFFNTTLEFYAKYFSGEFLQNKRLLAFSEINPLLDFNYQYRHILKCLSTLLKNKVKIILVPSEFIHEEPLIKVNLLTGTITLRNNVIDIFSLQFIQNNCLIVPITIETLQRYLERFFLLEQNLSYIPKVLLFKAKTPMFVEVEFFTVILSFFLNKPIFNVDNELLLWLYHKLQTLLLIQLLTFSFHLSSGFNEIPFYNTIRSAKLFHWDFQSLNKMAFKDFFSMEIKENRNLCYMYLQKVIEKANNTLGLSMPEDDLSLLKIYFPTLIETDSYTTKKAMFINPRYLITTLLMNWTEQTLLQNADTFIYYTVTLGKQLRRYINEITLYLRIFHLIPRLASKQGSSLDMTLSTELNNSLTKYFKDEKLLYMSLKREVILGKSPLSASSASKILSLLEILTRFLIHIISSEDLLILIQTYNFNEKP